MIKMDIAITARILWCKSAQGIFLMMQEKAVRFFAYGEVRGNGNEKHEEYMSALADAFQSSNRYVLERKLEE